VLNQAKARVVSLTFSLWLKPWNSLVFSHIDAVLASLVASGLA
jgi:hypothetical protein